MSSPAFKEMSLNHIHFKGGVNVWFLSSLAKTKINPLVTNELSHPYQMDESTFIFRGIRSDFSFLFHSLMKIT